MAALSEPRTVFDLSNTPYTPGYVGLNNIKANDYLNVVIHALLHVPLLRDSLLLSDYTGKESEILKRFAALAKKLWNSSLFKAQVSPHEFLQEVARASAGRFKITQQGDPVEFLGWLLNVLHRDGGGTKRRNSSIIYSAFQGELRLDTQQVIVKDELSGHIDSARPEFDIDRGKRPSGLSHLCFLINVCPDNYHLLFLFLLLLQKSRVPNHPSCSSQSISRLLRCFKMPSNARISSPKSASIPF